MSASSCESGSHGSNPATHDSQSGMPLSPTCTIIDCSDSGVESSFTYPYAPSHSTGTAASVPSTGTLPSSVGSVNSYAPRSTIPPWMRALPRISVSPATYLLLPMSMHGESPSKRKSPFAASTNDGSPMKQLRFVTMLEMFGSCAAVLPVTMQLTFSTPAASANVPPPFPVAEFPTTVQLTAELL